jgi:hypothetical protein
VAQPADFEAILTALDAAGVEFVVIGGLALVAHGGTRATVDVDLAYSRDTRNLERLALALKAFRPWLRGAGRDLPFTLDAETLRSGLNFTLSSEAGDIDLMGEVPGLGAFEAVRATSVAVEVFGRRIAILSLDGLERSKRAAGRAKDLLDLATIAELKSRERRGLD